MKIISKVTLLFASLFLFCPAISAQINEMGQLNSWTFGDIYSREKDDEVLPVSYKMRVSKNKGFDRIVIEFAEKEVPEYSLGYTQLPIAFNPSHLENPDKPAADEIIKIKGKAFITINFALGFDGISLGKKFSSEQHLPVIKDIKGVDWFENFYTFAVGLQSKKPFRVQELSNPARIVIDIKNSGK